MSTENAETPRNASEAADQREDYQGTALVYHRSHPDQLTDSVEQQLEAIRAMAAASGMTITAIVIETETES